jgi:oligopeptide/dipeptide ABC transporter ATP-binding protein
MNEILQVENLKTHFYTRDGIAKAVNGVSFSVLPGEIFGLVGESGSGKSMTLRSILRLVPSPGKIVDGRILYDGKDILSRSSSDMTALRGNEISMIFQDPMTALNPVMRVGDQLFETLQEHGDLGKKELHERAIELFRLVAIPSPERRLKEYPHEFSGGMRQRAMIAIALACNPKILLADEPTTAIDVTLQDQILRLILDLQERLQMSVIWVTHDLGVTAMICKRVGVMYAGKLLEIADTNELLEEPRHPYTLGLLESLPTFDKQKEFLVPIPGSPPDVRNPPSGCPFHPRCRFVSEECKSVDPSLQKLSARRFSACIRVEEIWK